MSSAPDAWILLFDRLDKIDRSLLALDDNFDSRLRKVENEVAAMRSDFDSTRSRISRETKAATDADQSLSSRVHDLELKRAAASGERKGEISSAKKFAALVSVLAAGGTIGLKELVSFLGS